MNTRPQFFAVIAKNIPMLVKVNETARHPTFDKSGISIIMPPEDAHGLDIQLTVEV